jgi:hypothetical protein
MYILVLVLKVPVHAQIGDAVKLFSKKNTFIEPGTVHRYRY